MNFNSQKDIFIKKEKSDKHHDFHFIKEIPHHAEHCLVYNPKMGKKPWYCNLTILITLDIFMLGWF